MNPMTRTLPTPQRLALTAASLVLMQSQAFAHGGDDDHVDGTQWGLGIAVTPEVRPYRDVDNKTEVWPLVTFENRWVRLLGPGLEVKLGQVGPASFGLTASYARDGYKPGDSPFLEGMEKRKASFWLGGRIGLRTEIANIAAEWSGDASGNSKGQKLRLEVARRTGFGDLGVTPRLAATWHDRKFTQYYFGVESAEARAARPAYSAGSSTDTEIGLRLDYRLAPPHLLFADLGVTALGSTARNSPLVDRSTVPEVRIGYLYRF